MVCSCSGSFVCVFPVCGGLISPSLPTQWPPCYSDKPFGVTADLSLVCVALPPPLLFPSNFHQQTFVFLLSSEVTDEPLPSVSPCLFSSLCAQPATGMYLEERLARPTGSNKFKAALEPGCLSQLLSLLLLSHSSASCSVFSFCPPAPSGLPFFLLVVPANPFAFCCSFSPLLPPRLLFSPLSALFLWHEGDTKRSFECLCV